MLHITERVNGKVLWRTCAVFWLSLVPFVIRWIDETGFTALRRLLCIVLTAQR